MGGENVGSIIYDARIETRNLRSDAAKVESTIDSSTKRSGLSFGTLAKVAVGALGTIGAFQFTKSLVSQAAELQSIRASFESMTGSVAETDKVLKSLYKFSFKTAFATADINKAAQLLLGAGLRAKDLGNYMQWIGDVAGATGADLGALTLPLSQALSRGKLQTQDFYQILNSGAGKLGQVLKKELADRGMGDFNKAMEDGKVTSEILFEVLRKSSAKGGFAFQGAIKQADTFNGRVSNLIETVSGLGLKILGVDKQTATVNPGGPFDIASKAVLNLTDYINNDLPGAFSTTKRTFDTTIGAIGRAFQDLYNTAQKGDWKGVGRKIGDALAAAMSFASDNLGTFITKAFDKLKEIDWLGIGIKVGREAIPFIIGLVAGILDVDLTKLLRSIWDNLPTILLGLLGLALAPTRLLRPIAQIVSKIPFVGGFIVGAVKALKGVSDWFFARGLELVGSLVRGFVSNLGLAAPKILPAIMFFVRILPNALKSIAGEIWQNANVAVGMIGRAIAENGPRPVIVGFGIIRQQIMGFLDRLGVWLLTRGYSLIDGFGRGVNSAVGVPIAFMSSLIGRIIGMFRSAGSWLLGHGFSLLRGLRDGALNAIGFVLSFFDSIDRRILGAVGNLGGLLFGAGKSVVNGLINGIKSAAGGVTQVVGNLARDVEGTFKNALGIKSPSRVMMQLGDYVMAGFAIGMNRSTGLAVASAQNASQAVLGSFGGGVLSPTVSGDYSPYKGSSVGAAGVTQNNYISNDIDLDAASRQLAYQVARG